jgi:hypothetical protein
MRKSVFVFCLLLLVSNAALADWKKFGGNSRSDAYYNPSSMVVDGHIVKVTMVSNFSSALPIGNKSALSSILNYKFDCQKNLLAPEGLVQMFSKKMGKGDVVFSRELPETWSPVENSPDTETEFKLFNLACAKHK